MNCNFHHPVSSCRVTVSCVVRSYGLLVLLFLFGSRGAVFEPYLACKPRLWSTTIVREWCQRCPLRCPVYLVYSPFCFFLRLVVLFMSSSRAYPFSPAPTSHPIELPSISALTEMKEPSNKPSRLSLVYPKKRPSPHGVSKKTPRRSPRSSKTAITAHLHTRREGAFVEEEYRDDIRCYMHQMEVCTVSHCSQWSMTADHCPQSCTMSSLQSMDQQPEIRWHMRPCLVDFLVEVHFSFRLRPETLYLALNIIDRYVSRRIVYVKHYQLVGCAALWIAAKFEDAKDRVPTVQDLVQMCHDTYEESAFIQMEGHVLSTIQWTLGHPTAEAWLRLMCCGPCLEDPKVQHVARFLMEITLFYREFVRFPPSCIALASLTLARYICGKPRRLWEENDESLDVVELLDERLAKHVNDLSETLVKKYSYVFYSKAATFVVHYYLQGGHFSRQSSSPFPITPTRGSSPSPMSTPMSASTATSDNSDDFPLTPSTPAVLSSELYISSDVYMDFNSDDKENMPSTMEPVQGKQNMDVPPEYLPHDFVTFGRSALHNRNVSPQFSFS